MALNFRLSPFLLSHPSSCFLSPPLNSHHHNSMFLFLLNNNLFPPASSSSSLTFLNSSSINAPVQASTDSAQNGVVNNDEQQQKGREREGDELVLGDELVSRASRMKDATEVVELIVGKCNGGKGGVVSCSDCCRIISAALFCNNSELALSIFTAMRSSNFDQVLKDNGGFVGRWKWSSPDLNTYTTLVIGLAALLRVSDALEMIEDVCRVGLSPGEEVPFGKIIRCPTCMIAVAVAQPEQGFQVVCCAKCRYQYELVSGDIRSIQSEEIRISSCRTQHGCSSLEKMVGISSINKANSSLRCPFSCDQNPFQSCSYS